MTDPTFSTANSETIGFPEVDPDSPESEQ